MAKFRLAQNYGKYDIKTYLNDVYDMNVKKVHTANFDTVKKKTRWGLLTKQRRYKIAYVFYQESPEQQKKSKAAAIAHIPQETDSATATPSPK